MLARALLAIAALAGCAHASGGATPTRPSAATMATEAYLGRLIAGDRTAIAGAFSGPPAIDDPFGGAVLGDVALDAFVAQRRAWLTGRAARGTPGPPPPPAGRAASGGRLRALRVYPSFWPLEGHRRVRAALLRRDPAALTTGAVAEY